jgi:hypothetical protein
VGPEWLSQHQEQRLNTSLLRHPEILPEQRDVTTVKVMIQCSPAKFITRFSSLSKLQRVAAYSLRFSHNAKNPSLRTGYFTSTELRDALHTCIKIAQQESYAQEINDLSKKGQVSPKSQLQPLHPFLDKEGSSSLWKITAFTSSIQLQTSTNIVSCRSYYRTNYNE